MMKTFQKLFLFIFTLVFIAGCSDDLAPLEDHSEVQKQLKGGDKTVVESISGSGHIYRDYGEFGEVYRTFTLHAKKQADGTVKGKYQLNNHDTGVSLNGDVLCFTLFDNSAVVIVQWRKVKGVELEWPLGYIVIEDNGEDGVPAPDRISLHHDEGWEWYPEDCDILFETPLYPIVDGNFQIHVK